jgi:hypothetical protein
MAQVTGGGFTRRLLLAVLLLAISAIATAADASLEYSVKATYLLNFTKFINWPADAAGVSDAPFNICLSGGNPFGAVLDQVISGETVNGRKMAIQIPEREPAPGACQLIFFAGNDEVPPRLLNAGRGVLTVGQGEDFARNGGMIGFVVENRRVTFYINLRAASAAGLTIRSGLLNVARSVIR